MATTFTSQITNQDVSQTTSYCYLYEPLKIKVNESDALATKIYVDLTVLETSTGSVIDTQVQYGDYDINPNSDLDIDLSRMIQQYHDANVFTLGLASEISSTPNAIVSKYKYQFKVYSDKDANGQVVSKLPIIGGRDYFDFSPSVLLTQPLTEADIYGVTLSGRWKNYPNISQSLADPDTINSTPTITVTNETTANTEPCGGMLIWKSRFGGWMYWGMGIAKRTPNKSYVGDLSVGMFEANENGNPYVQVDYTQIENSYSIELRDLALTTDELKAVSGIINSPAVYYMRDSSAKLELMRLTSASAPISTLIGGGDFTVQLQNISQTSQKTR